MKPLIKPFVHPVPSMLLLLTLTTLTACEPQQPSSSTETVTTNYSLVVDKTSIAFSSADPRLQHIHTQRVNKSDAPVIPPINGFLAYDELKTVRVSSSISGRVVSTPLPLGQSVYKNEVLLKLDSPEFNQAQSDLEKSSADFKLKQESFERAKTLFASKVISQKEYAETQDQLASAKSEFERARKRLENLGVLLNNNQASFHLKSPVTGIITEVNINTGMEVRPDLEKPLYVVSDLSSLWLWMDVFEKDIAEVHLDQPVQVRVASYKDKTFTGKVDYISHLVNEKTRSIRVRCMLDNTDQKLLPTMNAQATILNLPNQAPLLIPLSAVLNEGVQSFVFVKNGDHHYLWHPIELGLRLKDSAIVNAGLSVGDEIVVKGAMSLRQQMLLSME